MNQFCQLFTYLDFFYWTVTKNNKCKIMKVKVKLMNGSDFVEELPDDSSVMKLMENIATRLSTSVDCLRVIFSGRVSYF